MYIKIMSNKVFLCKKIKISNSDVLGRHFVADGIIKKGERILTEQALVIGPHFISIPVCLSCWTPVAPLPYSKCCSRCSIAPLCAVCYDRPHPEKVNDKQKNTHNLQECDAFKKSKLTHKILMDNLQIVMPFRCLLLDEQKFNHILTMEAHMEKRRNTPIWSLCKTSVIQPLYNFELVDHNRWNEEILQNICGILDVNTFELRSPAGTAPTARALYPTASLMSHDCSPNVHVTLDKNNEIRAFASSEIGDGVLICCSYTNIMHPTWKRREHLREGKYFDCICNRCKDATELGTHLQSLMCTNCSTGRVLPMNPISSDPWSCENKWNCLSCNNIYPAPSIKVTLDALEAKIAVTDKYDEEALEELLTIMTPVLTPNHYLMLEVKEALIVCLRDKFVEEEKPSLERLRRKMHLCKEIVDVLKVLEPGLSRLGGIAHYELYVACSQLANAEMSRKEISRNEFLERLKYADILLRTAINLLIYEPENTPEGILVKTAFSDLHIIKNAMLTAN